MLNYLQYSYTNPPGLIRLMLLFYYSNNLHENSSFYCGLLFFFYDLLLILYGYSLLYLCLHLLYTSIYLCHILLRYSYPLLVPLFAPLLSYRYDPSVNELLLAYLLNYFRILLHLMSLFDYLVIPYFTDTSFLFKFLQLGLNEFPS